MSVRIRNEIDERSIGLNLARKGISVMDIEKDLVATLGSDTMGNCSVTHFLRGAKFPWPDAPTTFSEDKLSSLP
jgi:hypothetical protein